MAQYGYNIYGTSVYGKTNAVNGTFVSSVIDAGAVLTTNLNARIIADLPMATYEPSDGEFNTVGITTTFRASFSSFTLTYTGTGTYTLRKLVGTEWTQVETGALNAATKIYTGNYAAYELDTTGVTITNIVVQTTWVNVYVRSALTEEAVESAEYVLATVASRVLATEEDVIDLYDEAKDITAYTYKTNYASATGTSHRYYQFKLELLTSDNSTTPVVKEHAILCGDSTKFNTDGGEWTAVVDMGASFASYSLITWDSTEPADTLIIIQTATSNTIAVNAWSGYSNPYTKDANQVRILAEQTSGYIETPLVTPNHLKKWTNLLVNCYDAQTPKGLNIPIRVVFYNANDIQIGPEILNPSSTNLESFLDGTIAVPMYARFTLSRSNTNHNTPTLSSYVLKSNCEYSQTKENLEASISRVYGEKLLSTIDAMGFTNLPEPAFGNIEYQVTAYTNGKRVNLYWLTEKDKAFPNRVETSGVNTLCCTSNEPYSFNYITSIVYFAGNPTIEEVIMTNAFIPALNTSLKYQYKIFSTWVQGEDLESISDVVDGLTIEWANPIDISHKTITEKSEINDSSYENDKAILTLDWENEMTITPWRSDEYISDIVRVNHNGLLSPYNNDKVSLPAIDQYAYINPDCYKVEIVSGSIKRNGMSVPEQAFNVVFNVIYPSRDEMYTDSPIYSKPKTEYVVVDPIIRGAGTIDRMRYNYIDKILAVVSTDTATSTYPINSDFYPLINAVGDYEFDKDTSSIHWTGTQSPTIGEQYYVHYVCKKPIKAKLQIGCDYKESKIIRNGVWKSNTEYEYTGTCYPGVDYISGDLNSIIPKNITSWSDKPANVTNFEYTIADNNLFVETKIENDRVIGTLGLINPAKNWIPKIKSGFYYIGKDEFYNYLDPETVLIGTDKIEFAQAISFGDGQDEGGAVRVEDASTNLIINSNFTVKSRQLSYVCDFNTLAGVATSETIKPIDWGDNN